MKVIDGYNSVIKKICWYVCYVSMLLVAVMMLLMTVDALSGKIFNQRILGTFELVQCMLCIIVFTSWAFTQTERGHIHVVMFLRMMPQGLRFICFSITSIRTATLLIPFWPFYVIELIAFVVLTLALLGDTLKSIAAIFNKKAAEDVMSSWT